MKIIRPVSVTDTGTAYVRASTATYYDINGDLKTAPANTPRYQYDQTNVAGGAYLLAEPAATNLLTYSEGNISQYPNTAFVTNATTSITGFSNSVYFPNLASITYFAYKQYTCAAGQYYTMSFVMQVDDSSIPVPYDNGVGTVGIVVENNLKRGFTRYLGGGKYLVYVTFLASGASGAWFGAVKYATASNTTPFRVTGMQLEVGLQPTSYIPTTTAAVTRAEDISHGNFKRASTGMYFDYNGVMRTAANDVPRFNYAPANLFAGPELLVEPAATNYLPYSSNLSNWNTYQLGVSSTVSTSAPDGTTMYKLIPNTANDIHRAYLSVNSVLPAGTYTMSLYVRTAELKRILIQQADTESYGASFDMSTTNPTATAYVGNTTSCTVTKVTANLYLCTLTYTISVPAQQSMVVYVCDASGNPTWASNNSDGLYLWGMQLEAGSVATSRIPTTAGIPVTRAADVNFNNFMRASPATYYDSTGILRYALPHQPRFSYDPSNLTAGPTLLLEKAAVNMQSRTANLESATDWIVVGCTVAPDTSVLAPDGSATARAITFSAVGNQYMQQPLTSYTCAVGDKLTFSIFARTSTKLILFGASTVAGTDVYSAIALPNGWYRQIITRTFAYNATGVGTIQPLIASDNLTSFAPVLIWGPQVEAGGTATSYVPSPDYNWAGRSADTNTCAMISNVPENDYAIWNSTTTYAKGDRVIDVTTHKVYESSVAGNLNKPVTDTTAWLDAGYNNRWELFDQSITSQTSSSPTIIVSVQAGTRIDSIAGLNVSSAKATINVVDFVYGNVYSKQVPLTSYGNITDWYSYFYEPVVQNSDFLVTDLPAAMTATSAITVSLTSATTSAIGGLVLGLSKEIGTSQWGTKVGIVDYTVKTKDAWGNYVVTPRNFSKTADFSVMCATTDVDMLQTLLASYRATPVVYVGSNASAAQQFNAAMIYGFFKDFSIDITYPPYSTCTLQVEGLT